MTVPLNIAITIITDYPIGVNYRPHVKVFCIQYENTVVQGTIIIVDHYNIVSLLQLVQFSPRLDWSQYFQFLWSIAQCVKLHQRTWRTPAVSIYTQRNYSPIKSYCLLIKRISIMIWLRANDFVIALSLLLSLSANPISEKKRHPHNESEVKWSFVASRTGSSWMRKGTWRNIITITRKLIMNIVIKIQNGHQLQWILLYTREVM